MAAWFRLGWQLQRSELRLLLGACLLVVVAGGLVVWQLRAVRAEELACYQSAPSTEDAALDACRAISRRLEPLEAVSQILHGVIAVAPFVLGLFLAVPIVGRELEGGTAPVAWALAVSRRRWLAARALPVLAFVAAAAGALAFVGELLTLAMPWAEGADIGFADYAMRGPLVVARTVGVFGIGLVLGALLGRQLPALLLAGAVTAALLAATSLVLADQLRRVAEPLPLQMMKAGDYQTVFGSVWRDEATGELLSDDELFATQPDVGMTGEPSGYTNLNYIVPARRASEFVLRESAIFALAGLAALGVAATIVDRRRPY